MARSLFDRLLERSPATVEGTMRTFAAMASDTVRAADLLGVLDGHESGDPFDALDPEYIERTRPALETMSNIYFRSEVRDLDNIPATGPVLLVGNHSGGTLIVDTFVFAQAFYGHFGPHRRFHQLAHDLVFKVPGPRAMLSRYGTVPASPANMRKALGMDAALLVYPGGDHETYRPSWESSEIDFAGRTGFARLALELNVPIVPIVAIGGQETALFLGQGRSLAAGLGLDRLRLKVLPAQLAPPFGLTVLDLPLRIPLPAKITVQALPPIDLRKRLGKSPDPGKAYDLVTGEMQDALDDLADERLLPVLG